MESEASYLTGSGQRSVQAGLSSLIVDVASTIVAHFGSCLVLEIWTGPPAKTAEPVTVTTLEPGFRIVVQKGMNVTGFVDRFHEILSRIRIAGNDAAVGVVSSVGVAPPGLPPILSRDDLARIGCHFYGLEVSPVFQDPQSGEIYTAVFREFRQSLTKSLRRIFFEYARTQTTHRPPHFHALGRRATVKAVWEVDRMLAEVSDSFDFLLQLTPVNTEEAWRKFRRYRYERPPRFYYRPLRVETVTLKRNLYKAPVERIEDPALGQLFREKMDELDLQITLLKDRNTPRFVHGSEQLFGEVEAPLVELARQIMERTPSRSRDESGKEALDAEAFAGHARQEIEYYRSQYPGLDATVHVRRDVSTMMVSCGSLLVSRASRIPATRVEALIQHEIGTHILTYYNGRAQRLRLLYGGLAGYNPLQEGLAVLSEYLVGGMSRPRLRLLAARVIAARSMLDGASFIDTFRELNGSYNLGRRVAFTVAMRAYRGGGLSKDAVYLKGLRQILEYLGKGGELEPLFVGKISVEHIPIIRELQWRGVLTEPPLKPRYLNNPEALARLDRVREGMSVPDLVGRSKK